MTEQKLLTAKQVAEKLGISIRTLYRRKDTLILHGLREAHLFGKVNYLSTSVDKVIKKSIDKGIKL